MAVGIHEDMQGPVALAAAVVLSTRVDRSTGTRWCQHRLASASGNSSDTVKACLALPPETHGRGVLFYTATSEEEKRPLPVIY